MHSHSEFPAAWLHPSSLGEAAGVQHELAARVVAEDDSRGSTVERIAGVDISHQPRDPNGMIHAAVVTLSLPALAVSARADATVRSTFPYVPGFLGFREVPALVEAFRTLPAAALPDLIVVDGHGLSHPRGLGIASHLGVLLDRPTIGVAKSVLVGKPVGPPGPEPGDRAPLVWRGRTVGLVLRTKRRTNPVYVSVGHRVSLESAAEWVMRTVRGYRLPEPTRQAHLAANDIRRRAVASAV
jgi:deoxyribonuclease V